MSKEQQMEERAAVIATLNVLNVRAIIETSKPEYNVRAADPAAFAYKLEFQLFVLDNLKPVIIRPARFGERIPMNLIDLCFNDYIPPMPADFLAALVRGSKKRNR